MIVGMTFFSVSAQAIGISLKIDFGKRNAEGNCGPGRGICSITLGATLRAAQGENFQVVEADAELKGDKLFIKLPKGINEKGINEKGVYSVNIQKNQPVDQDVAKKLGTTELSIVPGSYEVKNNC